MIVVPKHLHEVVSAIAMTDSYANRLSTRVTVLEEYADVWSMAAFKELVEKAFAEVPAHLADSAKVRLQEDGALTIDYKAPETDAQYDKRLQDYIDAAERLMAAKELKERTEFERLCQKYGVAPRAS